MADILQTPYATAMPYVVTAAGGWTDTYDTQRLASYDLYDDLYHNDPTTVQMLLRSNSVEKAIRIPTAAKIIKSLARYVGKNWGYKVLAMPLVADQEGETAATDQQVADAQLAYGQLFARERILSQFRAGIPEWLRRGDWCWLVAADANKAEGRRISVKAVDPRRYFPLNRDPNDSGRITGQRLIEETMVGDVAALTVQEWLKYTDPGHPNYDDSGTAVEPPEGYNITYSMTVYDQKDFGDPVKQKVLSTPIPVYEVEGITNLPIYHIKNNEETDDPFGRSDLSGVESLIQGINQSITDEDLSLALMGIGMYWTNSGAPIDETTGQPTTWKLGPNRVIEVGDDNTFEKVEGITSVEPFQDHVSFLQGEAQGVNGLSDVSMGVSDQATAESGIALAIRFSPTEDAVTVKNDAINGVMTQMFHDLKQWFNVFEGYDFGTVDVVSETDNANLLPFDRTGRFTELVDGVTAGFFTPEYAVQVLEEEFGYVFPADYLAQLTAANAAKLAATDPFATRAGQEAGAGSSDGANAAAAQAAGA